MVARLEDNPKMLRTVPKEGALERYTFSGHESFPLRYAWLPKGVKGVTSRPDLFTRMDAPVLLGSERTW